jgi:UDP-glucuronate 4-epimerase
LALAGQPVHAGGLAVSLTTSEASVLDSEKILITGVTGKIAFPIARALAARNEVWGAARLSKPVDRQRLTSVGIRPLQLDLSEDDLSSVPEDFTYVFHAAVDPGLGEWRRCVRTNAHSSGNLLHHCRKAKGFVYCSTGSIYQYQGQRPLAEADGPGVPQRANYSFSKIAGEAVCSWVAEQFRVPLTIIRICSTYGPLGGAPADRLEMMLQGRRIELHPDRPNNFNPIYEDDYVELGVRAMEVASVPPLVVNWAGSETVSAEAYCEYMGELVGVRPTFEYTASAHTPLWPDVTLMHQVLGRTKVHWRDGFRRMIEARHPELMSGSPRAQGT